jgi:hypothetical protein
MLERPMPDIVVSRGSEANAPEEILFTSQQKVD